MLGKDIQSVLSLQPINILQVKLATRIKMLQKGKNALFRFLLMHHHMRVEISTEDDLAIMPNDLVYEQPEDLDLDSVFYLLGGEVETGKDEWRFVGLLDGLQLFVGEAEGYEREAFAPMQKTLFLDIVQHWFNNCTLFWLEFGREGSPIGNKALLIVLGPFLEFAF